MHLSRFTSEEERITIYDDNVHVTFAIEHLNLEKHWILCSSIFVSKTLWEKAIKGEKTSVIAIAELPYEVRLRFCTADQSHLDITKNQEHYFAETDCIEAKWRIGQYSLVGDIIQGSPPMLNTPPNNCIKLKRNCEKQWENEDTGFINHNKENNDQGEMQ